MIMTCNSLIPFMKFCWMASVRMFFRFKSFFDWCINFLYIIFCPWNCLFHFRYYDGDLFFLFSSLGFHFLDSLRACFCLFVCWLVGFLPYSRSYNVHFSFLTVFSVSRHISRLTMCDSHFPTFSVFLTIFQVLQRAFLIFHIFHVSHHIPDPTVCV